MAPRADPAVVALQTAINSANGYYQVAIWRCNEALVVANAPVASALNNCIVEMQRAIQKVQKAAAEADFAFQTIIIKLVDNEELNMFEDRVTKVCDPPATTVVMYIQATGAAEVVLPVKQPTPVVVVAAVAAVTALGAPGHVVDALKPGILTLDASPIDRVEAVDMRKLVMYLCPSESLGGGT